jgi:hypothetical protein
VPDRKPREKTARAGSFGELRSPSLKSETAQVGDAKRCRTENRGRKQREPVPLGS